MAVNPDGTAGASRRDFLRLAAAAGLLVPAGLGCGGLAAATDPPATPPPEPPDSGRHHLARGLFAMSDAHHRGWVSGHHGAAVIAAHYFCGDNGLGERAERALRGQVDAFIARSPAEFPAPDPGRGAADPAAILEPIDRHAGELRSGGHGAIYASLALRAFRDLPEYATPAIVEGVRCLLEQFVRTASAVTPSAPYRDDPPTPYRDGDELAAATLRALLRPWGHVRQVGTSGVLHWVTHAEALLTLEDLGHRDVALRCRPAQQLHIHPRFQDDGSPEPEGGPVDWLGPEYWESDAPRRPLDGSWLFGHSFKLPYSLFRVLRRVDDPALRSDALVRAAKLSIPFAPRG